MADAIEDTTTSAANLPTEAAGAASYSPDAMRQVITSLREAAATRASLERKIASEYAEGCEATRREADRLIQETIDRYDDKIASTQREYEELKQRAEAQFAETAAKFKKAKFMK